MNLHQLAVYVEVVRSGTMIEAAEALFISQPAVSKTIAALEDKFDTKLFERIGNRLIITDSGTVLYRHAVQLLDQAAQAENDMKGLGENIRVGATLTVGNTVLSQIIKNFQADNPKVKTKIKVTNTREIEELLLQSKLDIALVEGDIRSPVLKNIPAIKDSLVIACSAHHPLAGQKQVHLEDLARYPFHMRERGSGTRETFENFMFRHGYNIDIAYESTCPISIRQAVEDFDLISVISFRLIEDCLRDGSLYAFHLDQATGQRVFSIVYHRNKKLTPTQQALINQMKKFSETPLPDDLIQGQLVGVN